MVVPKSVEAITEARVRNYLDNLIKSGQVIGILLQGSRITGFNSDPRRDWDFLIYVATEYFESLDLPSIHQMDIEEIDGKKRLVGDYAFACDKVFENQLTSPMDIDHIAYVNSVSIYDPTGKAEEWRLKLADFPEEMYEERVRSQAIQLGVAFGYAKMNTVRGNDIDAKINYFRTISIATVFWFSLQKSWTPQHKWWSKHARRLGMSDQTFNLFEEAINDINIDKLLALIQHLMELAKVKGLTIDLHRDFLLTLVPEGRVPYIRHSYF